MVVIIIRRRRANQKTKANIKDSDVTYYLCEESKCDYQAKNVHPILINNASKYGKE